MAMWHVYKISEPQEKKSLVANLAHVCPKLLIKLSIYSLRHATVVGSPFHLPMAQTPWGEHCDSGTYVDVSIIYMRVILSTLWHVVAFFGIRHKRHGFWHCIWRSATVLFWRTTGTLFFGAVFSLRRLPFHYILAKNNTKEDGTNQKQKSMQ